MLLPRGHVGPCPQVLGPKLTVRDHRGPNSSPVSRLILAPGWPCRAPGQDKRGVAMQAGAHRQQPFLEPGARAGGFLSMPSSSGAQLY